jgi:hypothetical protein
MSDAFPIQISLEQGDALSPLLFNFVLEYSVRTVEENLEGLESNGTHELVLCADNIDILILGENKKNIKKEYRISVTG